VQQAHGNGLQKRELQAAQLQNLLQLTNERLLKEALFFGGQPLA
jgi:hypothetical protein